MINLIGHIDTKNQITTALASAKARNRELPHMLFSGHAGCGKTSMAKEIAKISGSDFIVVSPDKLKTYTNVVELMGTLNHEGYDDRGNRVGKIKPTIVFFDEIHRMPVTGQEILGIVMENFTLETGKPNRLFWVPYFTVVGATTLSGTLTKPFLDRFKFDFVFQPYTFGEATDILRMHASDVLSEDMVISASAIRGIAARGRGIPRILVRYLERVRDMAIRLDSKMITTGIVDLTFKELGVDKTGLTKLEIKILLSLYDADIAVGLENLSIITGESPKNIKDSIEPYLIRRGMMLRTGSGRIITPVGREYLEENGYINSSSGKQTIPVGYERK